MKKILNREDCFLFGHIRKSQGIHGAVKIVRENDLPIELDDLKFFHLDLSDGLIPFQLEAIDELSGISLMVKFVDILKMEDTKEFQNIPVYLPLSMLPADAVPNAEEAWLGFEVKDKSLGLVGKVIGFIHFNEQSLLKLASIREGKEILIPMVEEIILSVNMQKKLITVELPEGLADLND